MAAIRYIFGHPHDGVSFFTRPFYDPSTWSTKAVLGGTSVAVLTYIGFDGISTLSEEAENPRRNILLATVFTCVTTQGPASITETGVTEPSSLKTWVIPIFLPNMVSTNSNLPRYELNLLSE